LVLIDYSYKDDFLLCISVMLSMITFKCIDYNYKITLANIVMITITITN